MTQEVIAEYFDASVTYCDGKPENFRVLWRSFGICGEFFRYFIDLLK